MGADGMLGGKTLKKRKREEKFSPMFLVLFIMLILYTLCILLPMVWGLLQSFQDPEKLYNPIPWPLDFQFSNYIEAFQKFYVPVKTETGTAYPTLVYMFGYSFVYAVGAALVSTFVPCVVGYLTARFDNWFSRLLNSFVIIAMALPVVGSLPSELQIARALGLYDTLFGIWIMKSHFLSMYYLVFYARFKGFSSSYEEAARVDGANYFSIFFRIILPLVTTIFLTVFILQFINFWNDYYTPLMYMPSYPTVAYGMYYFNVSQDNTLASIPMKITGCMIMMLPVLILFVCFSKRLMTNLTIGGVKE